MMAFRPDDQRGAGRHSPPLKSALLLVWEVGVSGGDDGAGGRDAGAVLVIGGELEQVLPAHSSSSSKRSSNQEHWLHDVTGVPALVAMWLWRSAASNDASGPGYLRP